MNVLIGVTILLLVLVAFILSTASEVGKGGNAAKDGILLVVLCGISGFVVALASGSL
jgi:hypothetical protein